MNAVPESFPGDVAWTRPPSVRLDLNGPTERPVTPLPPDFTERSIHELFEATAARDPHAVALCDRAVRLTYAEVDSQARALACRIAAATPAGQAIGLLLPTSASMPLAILACLIAGRTCLVFDVHQPPERIAGIMRGSSVGAVIHDGTALCLPEGIARIPLADAGDRTASAWASAESLAPGDPAVVVYTSGSTGQPKGIVQSQRGILCRARQMIDAWHMHPGDAFLSLSIPSTIAGLTCFVAALLTGTRQLVVDLLQDSVRSVLAMAQREGVTILVGFPDMLRLTVTLGNPREMLRGLRIVRTAGGALTQADVEAWRGVLPPACLLMTTFGSTETMTFAQRFVPRRYERDLSRLPAGYPLPDHEFTVVDEAHRPVSQGEIGELVVRSRNIAIGEWQDGRCIPGRFIVDPSDRSQRILFTGDLIRQRSDGLVEFVGRRDSQVKIRGQRVELGEIEERLRAANGVDDAAVAARQDGEDVTLLAFVAAGGIAPEQRADFEQQLRSGLRQALPDFMLPARIIFLASLPRLASGKVDRVALLRGAITQ